MNNGQTFKGDYPELITFEICILGYCHAEQAPVYAADRICNTAVIYMPWYLIHHTRIRTGIIRQAIHRTAEEIDE
jgi:hypothetical protein